MNATGLPYVCFTGKIEFSTRQELDTVDITGDVREMVSSSGVGTGIVNLFVAGSTAALTTIEYEPGAVSDLKKALHRVAPDDIHYLHNERWGDGNGRSHVRAALLGPDTTIPVRQGAPLLGTWQQVILVELDTRARERTVHVTVSGTPLSEGRAP